MSQTALGYDQAFIAGPAFMNGQDDTHAPETRTRACTIFLIMCLGVAQGCEHQPIPSAPIIEDRAAAVPDAGFDVLPPRKAQDLFPAEVLKGDHFELLDPLTPDGQTYRYAIHSAFGEFEAYGEDMLRMRILEIRALQELASISQAEAFGSGILTTVFSPFTFLWNLATRPGETVAGIPEGLSRSVTRMGEMMKGQRSGYEDNAAKELVGFSRTKRQIAAKLGIDVYSSNQELQATLNEVAWATYAGEMGSRLATIPITGPAGLTLLGTSFGTTVSTLLRDLTPDDLRHRNRMLLTKMGADQDLIATFLSHESYSPRHQTIIVEALEKMHGVDHRSYVLQAALHAQREEEALFVQRLVEMMANFHHTVVSLRHMVLIADRIVVGYTADRAMAAFVPLTRLLWTPQVAEAVADVQAAAETFPDPVSRLELWLMGRASARSRKELATRGVMLHEEVLIRLILHAGQEASDATIQYLQPQR